MRASSLSAGKSVKRTQGRTFPAKPMSTIQTSPLRASRMSLIFGFQGVQERETLAGTVVAEGQFFLFGFERKDALTELAPLLVSELG